MTKTNCIFRIFILLFILVGCIQPPTYIAEPDPDPDPDTGVNPDPDPDPDTDPDPDEPDVDPPFVSELTEWEAIAGKAELGPFLKAAMVTLQELDESYTPTERMFTTSVISDQGNFMFEELELEFPYVLVSVEGRYFDQVRNVNSSDQVTLTAIEDLRINETIHINPISHLKTGRMLELMAQGSTSMIAADVQAQEEVLTQFGLQQYSGSQLGLSSFADGTYDAAVQVVVASILLRTGEETFGVARFLSELEDEFRQTGNFSGEYANLCWKNSTLIHWEEVAENLKEFYRRNGKNVTFKDFSDFIDWDGDGIAGNEDKDQRRLLFFNESILSVEKQGGRYFIPVTSRVDYEIIAGERPDRNVNDLQIKYVDYSLSLDKAGGQLVVDVAPATSWWIYPAQVVIYSQEAEVSDTLFISQESLVADDGQYTGWGEQYLAAFLDYCQAMELLYTHTHTGGSYLLTDFYTRSLSADTEMLLTAYQQGEKAAYELSLRRNDIMDHYPLMETQRYMYAVLEALLYYQMSGLWGQCLTVDDWNWSRYAPNCKPLGSGDIWKLKEADLLKARQILPVKREDPVLPAFRDVATVVLARYYLRSQNPGEALTLFEEIINSGRYRLERSWDSVFYEDETKEAILSFPPNANQGGMWGFYNDYHKRIPALTYGEVLLSAAECADRVGQTDKAWRYMNQLRSARGRSSIGSGDFISALADTWGEEGKGTASYLQFLKRKGLAESTLSILPYQTLWPIPNYYLWEYGMTQNPGGW
ncbi:MAG: hypothetical protein LUF85_09335 [Bacteroides sp.]|nr:hypothetical protein [Bacteroides sp.]